MLIREIFMKKSRRGTFGLEIETEVPFATKEYLEILNPIAADEDSGDVFPVPDFGLAEGYGLWDGVWTGVYDGSLRNFGVEYIFKEPLTLEDTLRAFEEFEENTRGVQFIEDAPGTSVHVHVNFLDEHLFTAMSFITLWLLFEAVLTEYSGPTRRSNLYAIPALCAKGSVDNYVKIAQQAFMGRTPGISESAGKYSALNPVSLRQLGTLEVRTMRGTTNIETLKSWVLMLYEMLEFSRGRTPDDILEEYQELRGDLLKKVFEKSYEDLKYIDSIDERLQDGLTNAYRLASSIEWSDEELKKAWGKSKKKHEALTPEVIFDELTGVANMTTEQVNEFLDQVMFTSQPDVLSTVSIAQIEPEEEDEDDVFF